MMQGHVWFIAILGSLFLTPATAALAQQPAAAPVAQNMNPNISVITDVAAAYFSREPMQSGAHDPSRSGVSLQQLELHMDTNVDPFLRFDANIAFSQVGVELEEAYATTLALPWNLQGRVGQFLTRFGRIHSTHLHAWDFMDQPLVVGRYFGAEGSRGLGGELSWLSPLPWYLEMVGSANEPAPEPEGGDHGHDGAEGFLYTAAVKQFFPLTDAWSLSWGVSGQLAGGVSAGGSETYGTDFYLRYRPVADQRSVSLTVEGMRRTPRDWGLYTQVVWRIDPRWDVGGRYDFVTGLDGDPPDLDSLEDRHRVDLQVTYHPSHFSKVRLQAKHDSPSRTENPIVGILLAVEVVAGAHGAHRF